MNLSTIRSKPFVLILLSLSLVISITFSFYIYRSQPKIAYIRTLDLVYGFNGMKEAHLTYTNQTQTLKANVDSLRIQCEREIADYKNTVNTLSAEEKTKKETAIKTMEANADKYASEANKQIQDKEKQLTQSVLNQVNSFVDEYAKSRGYDMVLGSDGNGSIMYGGKAFDITQDVLVAINKNYKILPGRN